jgi:hypothetical protein
MCGTTKDPHITLCKEERRAGVEYILVIQFIPGEYYGSQAPKNFSSLSNFLWFFFKKKTLTR